MRDVRGQPHGHPRGGEVVGGDAAGQGAARSRNDGLRHEEWDLLNPVVLAASIRHDAELAILEDLIDVRQALEGQMAAEAAERADAKQLDRIETAFNHLFAEEEDPARFLRADLDFHDAIMAASGNRLARAVIHTSTPRHSAACATSARPPTRTASTPMWSTGTSTRYWSPRTVRRRRRHARPHPALVAAPQADAPAGQTLLQSSTANTTDIGPRLRHTVDMSCVIAAKIHCYIIRMIVYVRSIGQRDFAPSPIPDRPRCPAAARDGRFSPHLSQASTCQRRHGEPQEPVTHARTHRRPRRHHGHDQRCCHSRLGQPRRRGDPDHRLAERHF